LEGPAAAGPALGTSCPGQACSGCASNGYDECNGICTVSMPWTALSARSSCCCLWFPSLQCSRASMGWGGPTWLHLLFTAGSLDSGACDADYGFLALHLPLGDHVLIYADITVAPSFPLWLHPGGVPPSGRSRIRNTLWIWQLAESKEMTVGLWQCETVRLWHGSRPCGPFGCGSIRLCFVLSADSA